MVFFNYALRKLNAKIVYYGPGLCGKTTNLQWIHDHFEGGQKGKMISLATEGDRTIFFDLLPLEIGTIRGMDVTLQLYTVPGQVHYNSTRQLVLRGADGVVFVADSQRTMQGSNRDAFRNLEENLRLQGIEIASFPHVLQFNKRDLRDLLPLEELDADLNQYGVPFFEAVATDGVGVQETLEGIVKLVMRSLRERYEQAAAVAPPPRGVTAPPAGGPRPPGAGPVAPPRSPMPPSPGVAPPRAPAAPPASPRSLVPPAAPRPPSAPGAAVRPPQPAARAPQPPTGAGQAPPPRMAPVHPPEERIEDEIQTADFGPEPSPSAWPPPPEASFEDAPTGVQNALEDAESAEHRLEDVDVGASSPVIDEPTLSRSTQAFEPPSMAEVVEPPPREEASPFEPEIDEDFASAPTETGLDVSGVEEIRIGDEGEAFDGPSIGDVPLEDLDEVGFEADAGPAEPEDAWEPTDGFVAEPEPEAGPPFEPAPPPPSSYVDEIRAPSPFVRRAQEAVETPLPEPSPFDLPGFADEPSGATEFLRDAAPESDPGEAEAAVEPAPEGSDQEWTPEAAFDEPMAPMAAPPASDEDVPPFEEPSEADPFQGFGERAGDETVAADRPAEEAPPPEVQPEAPPPSFPAAPAAERPEAPPAAAARPRTPAPGVDDLVASVLGDRGRPVAPRAPAGAPPSPPAGAPSSPPPVAERPPTAPAPRGGPEREPVHAKEAPAEPFAPVPPAARPAEGHHVEPVLVGDGDPFADEPAPAVTPVVEVVPARPATPSPPPLALHAHDNQLQVRLQGTGAIAESGQVRELDIQVPVPGSWVGNRRVTLQLRLTLMPAPEDENGGNGGPA